MSRVNLDSRSEAVACERHDGYCLSYCSQLNNKSLDTDSINEIPNTLIKVLLYKQFILIKLYDFTEILNLILYTWVYFPYCYLSLKLR